MKWKSLFFIFSCLLIQKLVADEQAKDVVTVKKTNKNIEFECNSGWDGGEKKLDLTYDDDNSNDYVCGKDKTTLTVKFRSCQNCIEVDDYALGAIIVGNLLATALIAYAVYSISAQPKSKSFSGNKASDKVNLIPNGERDTYQTLSPGQGSEYSTLGGKRK